MSASVNQASCYLCGRLLSHSISRDHCPPRALFAKEIRQQHDLTQLITTPVHKDCNKSYMHDEEYFIATMEPFARGSVAGDAAFKQFLEGTKNRQGKRVRHQRISDCGQSDPREAFVSSGSWLCGLLFVV